MAWHVWYGMYGMAEVCEGERKVTTEVVVSLVWVGHGSIRYACWHTTLCQRVCHLTTLQGLHRSLWHLGKHDRQRPRGAAPVLARDQRFVPRLLTGAWCSKDICAACNNCAVLQKHLAPHL